jgi:hypothetical protein
MRFCVAAIFGDLAMGGHVHEVEAEEERGRLEHGLVEETKELLQGDLIHMIDELPKIISSNERHEEKVEDVRQFPT